MRGLLILIFSFFLLIACAPMEPRMEMTYRELGRQVAGAGCGRLVMVGADGNRSVYKIATNYSSPSSCREDIFYYFQDNKLIRIDQGQLFEQRIRIN